MNIPNIEDLPFDKPIKFNIYLEFSHVHEDVSFEIEGLRSQYFTNPYTGVSYCILKRTVGLDFTNFFYSVGRKSSLDSDSISDAYFYYEKNPEFIHTLLIKYLTTP